ncbi:4-coumarate--CoA ligase 1-like [Neodiprion lecontei]|uniref:4-coumarate--CoA ligase 1-like n=1 Tax=Neodiprion lecontei TaxID=441921 RepID=A0ABM3FYS3_NEOLC|nr:4-coumarate--CoA ligase 1-like [Neodiprion lecontei]
MNVNNSGFRIRNHVLEGEQVSYNANYNSVGKFVLDRLESNPALTGQIDTATGEIYTFGKMRERSVRCALWMKSQGLIPRDVIAIYSEHQLDAMIPCYAALYLGAIFTASDVALETSDFYHRLSVTKPKIIFVSEKGVAAVEESLKATKLDAKIVVFGRCTGFIDFESAIAKQDAEEVMNFKCTPIESSREIALILFSSGTTDLPKDPAMSHAALLMQFCIKSEIFGMDGKICLYLPHFSWITGLHCSFMSLGWGIPRLITKVFDEPSIFAIIEKYKVNWLHVSPGMLNRFLKSDVLGLYDLSSLTRVIFSGTPLSTTSYEALSKRFPKIQIVVNYGTTEVGCVSLQSLDSGLTTFCGKIVENAKLKVIDPDTNRLLGPSEKGELLLKSTFMMNSYYENPEATAEIVDEEGWVHSGDFGYYDENGNVFVINRIKEIIWYHGRNVYPSEIENLILTHPGVMEVAVVGQPHLDDVEHPIAFVVRVTGSDIREEITETEIVDLVAARMPDHYRLRGGVTFLEDIPKTSTGKFQRRKLRDLVRAMVTP